MSAGTVTGAAKRLGLTQPAVTKIIGQTERQIGVVLFQRHRGRLHPTDEALAVFPAVDKVFQNVSAVQKIVEDLRDTRYGIIRIATTPTLGAAFLPSAIAAFLAGREMVKVGLKVLSAEHVVERVVNRQVDIGIVDATTGNEVTQAEDLCRAEVVCVLPPGHRLAQHDFVTPTDLRGERLISTNTSSPIGFMIDNAFAASDVRRESVVETSYSHIAYDLVARGVGLAVIDPFTVGRQRPPGLVLRPFRPAVKVNPRVLYLPDPPLSKLHAAFVKQLKQAAHEVALDPPHYTQL